MNINSHKVALTEVTHMLTLLCKRGSRYAWLMESRESIYELLGTSMKVELRGTAWLLQLSLLVGKKKKKGKRKNRLDSTSFPRKTSRTLSGKVQVTGTRCGNWRLLSEGSNVNRYSAVTSHPRKTCGSCKNNPPPTTTATIQSHCPIDRERGMCFFLRVSPVGLMYAWARVCVRGDGVVFCFFSFWCQGRQTGNTATGIDLEIDWGCFFSDRVFGASPVQLSC